MRSEYQDRIREQINTNHIVRKFRKQQKDDVTWQGNEVVVHLHSGRNYSGVKSTGEGNALGIAGQQSYAKLSVPIKDIKGRFGVSREVIEASNKGLKGAAAPALTREMEGLTEDIERQLNRQLFGFGSGTLATITTGVASATQTLSNPGGVSGTVNAARFIKAGMYVAITDSTGATIRDVQQVSSSSNSSNNMVLANSVTSTTGDLVSIGTISGSTKSSSFGKELMGLLGIVDQTTYVTTIFGLDRSNAANAFFLSGVKTSVGAISEDFLYRQIHNQWYDVSGVKVDTFFVHPSIEREYYKLTQADRRYQGADLNNPDAGVDMNAKPMFGHVAEWVADKDAPYGTLVAACTDNLFVTYMNEGSWDSFGMDGDAPELLRPVADQTGYEGVYFLFLNAYSDRGNAHFRLDGITATVDTGAVAD